MRNSELGCKIDCCVIQEIAEIALGRLQMFRCMARSCWKERYPFCELLAFNGVEERNVWTMELN
jgi:hypothetical protein